MELVVANQVNEEHRLARQSAGSAIEHAIKCGELLAEKKAQLEHGEFQSWIEVNCEFSYPTASAYMKVAVQKSRGLEVSSISKALGYGKKKEQPVVEDAASEEAYEEWCKDNEVIDDDEDEPAVSTVTLAGSAKVVADYCAEQAIGRLNDVKLNDPGAVEAITKVINHCNKLLRKIK